MARGEQHLALQGAQLGERLCEQPLGVVEHVADTEGHRRLRNAGSHRGGEGRELARLSDHDVWPPVGDDADQSGEPGLGVQAPEYVRDDHALALLARQGGKLRERRSHQLCGYVGERPVLQPGAWRCTRAGTESRRLVAELGGPSLLARGDGLLEVSGQQPHQQLAEPLLTHVRLERAGVE